MDIIWFVWYDSLTVIVWLSEMSKEGVKSMKIKSCRNTSIFFVVLAFIMAFSACDTGVSGSGPKPEPGPTYYTVTFISSAGAPVPSEYVLSGETVEEPEDPVRNDYGYLDFIGWYIDTTSDTLFDFSAPIVANTTLYARWELDLFQEGVGGEVMPGSIGPGGGIVFYIAPRGFVVTDTEEICFYLEAALDDIEEIAVEVIDKFALMNELANIRGTEEAGVGSGRLNTNLFYVSTRATPAAKACYDFNESNETKGIGKTDWFIPSLDELDTLYDNRILFGDSNFKSERYWSSTQDRADGNDKAWCQDFENGEQYSTGKDDRLYIRLIRAF